MTETTSCATIANTVSELCDKHGLHAYRDGIVAAILAATDIVSTPSSMDVFMRKGQREEAAALRHRAKNLVAAAV